MVAFIFGSNIGWFVGHSQANNANTHTLASTNSNYNRKSAQTDNYHNQLSVVITSYKQPICLNRMIQHLKTCSVVAKIHVNWFESTTPPIPIPLVPFDPDRRRLSTTSIATPNNTPNTNKNKPTVQYDVYPDRLSYRFKPREFLTDAVFSVDVDTYYTCDALDLAFQKFKAGEKKTGKGKTMVGFHPRILRMGEGIYDWRESFSPPFKRNTLFITKGGIVDKSAYEEYFKPRYQHLRDMVDEKLTAEDMLMSFILASKFRAQVIVVCLGVRSHCNVECFQNRIDSLHHRTREARTKLLMLYFEEFGDDFDKSEGDNEGLVWQDNEFEGEDRQVCKSSNVWVGAVPPCEFCSSNEVCPSNVYMVDPE